MIYLRFPLIILRVRISFFHSSPSLISDSVFFFWFSFSDGTEKSNINWTGSVSQRKMLFSLIKKNAIYMSEEARLLDTMYIAHYLFCLFFFAFPTNTRTHARAYSLCFRFKQCDMACAHTTVSIPLPSISDSHCMCLGAWIENMCLCVFCFAFFSGFFFSVECLQCWFHKTIGKCSAPVFSDILRSICQACEISIAHLNIEWKNRICSINDSVCAFLVGRFHIIIIFLAICFSGAYVNDSISLRT